RNEVKEAHLDVLLLCDVGMEPLSYFLGFSRLALVQAAWWGHPATTSAPEVDYFISLDAEVDHAAFDYYSEQLVRMEIINVAPFTMVDTVRASLITTKLKAEPATSKLKNACRARHSMPPPPSCLKGAVKRSLIEFLPPPVSREGLQAEEEAAAEEGEEGAGGGGKEKKKGPPPPGAAPVLPPPDAELYLVLGRLFKLHPDFDLAIIEILKGHANAHVVLIAEKHNNQITSLLWQRIKVGISSKWRISTLQAFFAEVYPPGIRHSSGIPPYRQRARHRLLCSLLNCDQQVTLPSAHVKGRFTLAMYKQVG
ncbi:unnamed protein product, partial [Heterosigma akashiwo]